MAQQTINIGSAPNDGTGDTLRDAFDKVNDNFIEVYGVSNSTSANVSSFISVGNSTINSYINSSMATLISLTVGNSTVNSYTNASMVRISGLTVGNSTVNTFANSSYIKSSTANITTMLYTNAITSFANVSLANANLIINGNSTYSIFLQRDGSNLGTIGSSGTLFTFQLYNTATFSYLSNTGTVIASLDNSGNKILTGSLSVGNSTINTVVNSSMIYVTGVNVGNSTINTVVNSSMLTVTGVNIGNSTINTVSNSSQLTVTRINVGNTTVNSIVNASNMTVTSLNVGNATHGTTLGVATALSTANITTSNSSFISTGTAAQGLTLQRSGSIIGTITTASSIFTFQLYNTATFSYLSNTGTVIASLDNSGNQVIASSISIGNSTVNSVVNSSILRATSANVVSNTGLFLGSTTKAANGYTFLPNGLKINWGWASVNSSAGDVTFTSSYTTVYVVQATSNTPTTTYIPAVTTSNATTASIRTANATSTNVYWMVIGV